MTTNTRNIFLSSGLTGALTFIIALVMFGKTQHVASTEDVKNELDKKATYEYVNRQDDVLQYNLDQYKQEQRQEREIDRQEINKKLDLIIKLIDEKD